MAAKNGNSPAEQYAQAKSDVDRQFPRGRFVALEDGRPVADADTHRALVETLQAQGKSPKDLLIIQAGIDYPKSAVIFFSR